MTMNPLKTYEILIFIITCLLFKNTYAGAGTGDMETHSDASSTNSAHKMTFFDRLGPFPQGSAVSVSPALVSGLDQLRDGRMNKEMAFSIEERQSLGIHGLLPPRVKTQDEQMKHVLDNIDRLNNNLDKYIYLMGLQERNEKLFYRVLTENLKTYMPFVYTPTVGLACQKYGLIFQKPRGLFISIHDAGHVYDVLKNWPEQDVRAIVVTDGERILGLGDLGVYGMGIPVGKLTLYTALAGIKPHHCLPITLDTGTNNESLLTDPDYIGSKQSRITGQQYYDFIEEFMQAAVKRYGQNVLIQFEDFGNSNAFKFLDTYRHTYCTYNGDIQGTASAALAGIFASLRITKINLSDNVILLNIGTDEAALGIAELCLKAMVNEGTTLDVAKSKIWLFDSIGLVVNNRPEKEINKHSVEFVKNEDHITKLDEAIKKIKPTVLIGAAGNGGVFTEEVIKAISSHHEHPVIFALSNPTSKSECTAEQAYIHSNGKALFASGSPFAPVTYGSETFYPSQANNSYIFPGVALGVICAGMKKISDDVFIIAARKLADLVTDTELKNGSLYPPLQSIQKWSLAIATEIVEHAYKTREASIFPEPKNKTEFIKAQLYDYHYSSALPPLYLWQTN